MTDYEFGDVLLVPFPFTDQTTAKKRPAVVVSSAAYHSRRPDVILLAVTTQMRADPGFGELEVSQWKKAGLLKPSVIKPVMTTIENNLVLRKLGRLPQEDRRGLLDLLQIILGE
jgi:mRNA interferase MazF